MQTVCVHRHLWSRNGQKLRISKKIWKKKNLKKKSNYVISSIYHNILRMSKLLVWRHPQMSFQNVSIVKKNFLENEEQWSSLLINNKPFVSEKDRSVNFCIDDAASLCGKRIPMNACLLWLVSSIFLTRSKVSHHFDSG